MNAGFLASTHLPLPEVGVGVKVGDRLRFRFRGGVGSDGRVLTQKSPVFPY